MWHWDLPNYKIRLRAKLGHCALIGCRDMLILVLKYIFYLRKVILRSRSNLRSQMERARNIDTFSIGIFQICHILRELHVNRKCDLENRKWWSWVLPSYKICLCVKLGHCALIGCWDMLILVIKYIFDLHKVIWRSRSNSRSWMERTWRVDTFSI